MDGLIVFDSENMHPLSWLLHKQHRHVWCAYKDDERGHWLIYDWRLGLPNITCADAGFDLAAHYREQGFEVIEVERGEQDIGWGIMLNNCVGHTKMLMGIKSWALTPHQLYKHLTRQRWSFRQLAFVPGGGGGSRPAPPPPPPPPPAPPPKKAERKQTGNRTVAANRRGLAQTVANRPAGGNLGAPAPAATTTKTLLGQ